MKRYVKQQFQLSSFGLEHYVLSDFHLSYWQSSRSPLPLLFLRVVIFSGCLATFLASIILGSGLIRFWFIFLTHWGLILNTTASFFALVVSLRAYLKGPTTKYQCKLPICEKTFWVFYNMASGLALFITLYYYTMIRSTYGPEDLKRVDQVLDACTHGLNSVLMLTLLLTSRVPGRMLHFVFPLGFGIAYLVFTVIYYYAGGTDQYGYTNIYSVLDWSKPGPTSVMMVVVAIVVIVVHVLLVGLSVCRDWLASRCRPKNTESLDISYS